jgi:hypothetical protein
MNEDYFLLLTIVIAVGISILINYIQKYIFMNIENKKKQYIKKLVIELSVIVLFVGISIVIANYLDKYWGFTYVCFFFLPAYSVYGIIRNIKLNNKKMFLKQIIFSFIQFLVINIILSLLVSLYIWNTRDVELIRITKLTNYTFLYVFIRINFYLFFISFIIIELFNLLKYIKINKYIYFRLIPLKISIICILLVFTNGWDGICLWDILSDTWYSDSFIINNIEKVEIGMEKEKVIELIGEPLYIHSNNEYLWTNDGKNLDRDTSRLFMKGDFAWFHYRIFFKDNKVDEIYSHWAYD